ncbi:glycoside-pentoside-hexuronide (GPH):cation symporter [Bacillus sp. Au-Bac7]|uniref:glycoside-pentoside-hexuronide (GPH):cation symporter n=1 Tax=Bacillus sp. Au-Bac7 TaxID=2906458 RepID=UPI001E30C238|nr:glycoside-pentoside-hexuronide (GPH):cation symporter [Bacillus sp. Au-Bac7]MCE4047430.1 glycoside-pentoside-hexuronide (GPH):cation symporter [Bacillus sp. Au-Bac7]
MNGAVSVWRQRIGYGVADFSCNLVWQMIGLYLMFYYTDVVGIAAAQVSLLFLLTRIIDGVADVLMGIIIDKTNTKWGKSRPYFLYGAIPFALLGILAFYVPDVGPASKLLYAYITYTGLSIAYTMVNIPLASILPNLTSDPQERTMLATVRIIFALFGSTAVSVLTMPMVNTLGNGSQSQGFFWTMVIFSVIACLLFFYTFRNVREKVVVQAEKTTVKQALSTLKGNKPYYVFAVNILFMWGAYFFQQGALIYYFTYNLDRADLVALIAGIGSFVPIVGTVLTPIIAKRMYKRTLFMISSAVNLVGLFIMLAAGGNIAILITGAIVSAIGHGARQSIYFSMQADPVDYGEWKTGINAAGILSALNGFIGKVTMAVAGALFGMMLTWGNYVPNEVQTKEALLAIKMGYLIIPAICVIISMIIMRFYNLDKIYPQIRAEIDARIKTETKEEAI